MRRVSRLGGDSFEQVESKLVGYVSQVEAQYGASRDVVPCSSPLFKDRASHCYCAVVQLHSLTMHLLSPAVAGESKTGVC